MSRAREGQDYQCRPQLKLMRPDVLVLSSAWLYLWQAIHQLEMAIAAVSAATSRHAPTPPPRPHQHRGRSEGCPALRLIPHQPQQLPYLMHEAEHPSDLLPASDSAPRPARARPLLPHILRGCPFPPRPLHTAGCSAESQGIAREGPSAVHGGSVAPPPVRSLSPRLDCQPGASTCSSHPPPA